MERSWLYARLPIPTGSCAAAGAATLISDVVAQLVSHLHRLDPPGEWYFDRSDQHESPRLTLGFRTTGHGRAVLAQWLADRGHPTATPADAARAGWPVCRDAARGGPLAQAGSELALALLDGGPQPADGELALAVLHLRDLLGLRPLADRSPLLFHFWEDRIRPLAPAQRRELAARADAEAEKIVLAADDLSLSPSGTGAWRRYRDAVTALVGDRDRLGDQPLGYLLLRHAELTHRRLGLPAEADALAAMSLRLTLVRERAAAEQAAAERAGQRSTTR